MVLAWAVVLRKTVFMKFMHSFLVANWECQAFANSETVSVHIKPVTETIANIASVACCSFTVCLVEILLKVSDKNIRLKNSEF